MTTLAAAPEAVAESTGAHQEDQSYGFTWIEAVRIGFVALTALAVGFGVWEPFPQVSVLGLLGLLIGGWPVFREAAENIVARRMTMELSMSIAIVAAAAISEFFTALIITLFVLVAEVLEDMTVARGRGAIRDLLDYLPRTVAVRRDGQICEVPVEELSIRDIVVVNPGARIAVDGEVIAGHSFVDQSPVNGESMPAEKWSGSAVFAGTINQSGALEIRTERIGRDTSYGKIIDLVEGAERSRAPVQRLADQIAGYLVYFTFGAALLTFIITRDTRSTISVIIVAGACGIAAGTPLAILGAIGRSARRGAIVKGGLYIETLARVKTVVLDKTGTLTFGRAEVCGVYPNRDAGVSEMEVLDVAAAAESRSEHPLGKAIVEHARAASRAIQEPDEFNYTPGRGITALVAGHTIRVGNRALIEAARIEVPDEMLTGFTTSSEVLVTREERLLGAISIADAVRPEARRAIEMIHHMGVRTLLLTGDARPIAEAVAAELGIAEIEAELLPEDKHARVRQLVANGQVVAMVGDGINDAPALSAADVGVAMGSGTDVARESADIVLLGNDLQKFAETLAIARWTRRIIWQNVIGTLAVDSVGIVLAAVGLLNPLLAAFIHVASEMTFILNSARLLPPVERISRPPPPIGCFASLRVRPTSKIA